MSESIWKKEIHLRRKPARPKPQKPESVWKKEITFRRAPRQVTIDELPAAVRAVLSPPEPEVAPRPPVVDPAAELAPWPSRFEPAPAAHLVEPELDVTGGPWPASFDDPVTEIAPWPSSFEPESDAVEWPAAPVSEPEPEVVVPPSTAERPAIRVSSDPWLSEPELPASFEDSAPAGDESKTSFWKKERSLRPQHAAKEPDAVPVAAERQVSFWRKERSLRSRRTPNESTRDVLVKQTVVAPVDEQKVSFWKKERSLRPKREPKVDEADVLPEAQLAVSAEVMAEAVGLVPVEPAAEVPAAPDPDVAVPAAPEVEPIDPARSKPSFWKKERSLRVQRAPKEPKVDALIEPAGVGPGEEPKVSFWKKERSLRPKQASNATKEAAPHEPRRLSLPRLRLPSLARPTRSHDVKRYVGLKVGASQLAAARVANNGAAELLQLAREPLAHGVVVGGELRDPEALADALKRFFARNKLPRRNVRLGIGSNRIGVRIIDVDGIDDERQLDNAIRFRAQEVLSIPLDEAVLDYHVLHERVDEGVTRKRVLLVVAYRELVERYVSACRKAGLSLAGIDLEAFALLRSISPPRADDQPANAAVVAVSIGHDRSTFAVSDGRVCEFTRVIEWGGSSLSIAIARAVDLAPSEVESLKRALSLERSEVPEGFAPEQYQRAVTAVQRALEGFARELVSSLQFYQAQDGSHDIAEIVITGGTAGLHGLAAALERLVGVGVRVGDPLARLKVAKKVPAEEQIGSLAVAIGLGIED